MWLRTSNGDKLPPKIVLTRKIALPECLSYHDRTFWISDDEDLRDRRMDSWMSKGFADKGVELADNIALRTIVANF